MTSTTNSPLSSAEATRERILRAAALVFARDGLDGATTRAIAQEAGVNEVTLFRHFKTKDNLLAAVVGQNFGPDVATHRADIPPTTDDLQNDLTAIATSFDRVLAANLPLVRTMLGEIQRYQEHERQVFQGIFHPLKAALRSRLDTAARAGELRAGVEVEIYADLFVSMVFMGVLRRNMPHIRRGYSNHAYLQGLVETFLHGAADKKA